MRRRRVPHLAPRNWTIPHLAPSSYEHTPTEVWLTPEHGATVCDGGEDPRCSDSVPLLTALQHIPDHTSYYGLDQSECWH